MIRTLILLLVAMLSACSAQVKLQESDLRSHIIGSWRYNEHNPPDNYRQWLTFQPDGVGLFGSGGGCINAEDKGTWSISGTTVHVQVRESKNSFASMDAYYEIQSMTYQKMKLRELESGKVYVFKRQEL